MAISGAAIKLGRKRPEFQTDPLPAKIIGRIQLSSEGWTLSEEERYRHLAAQARTDAERASDAYDKRTLLLVAQRYDVLADRARTRQQDKKDECA
jgi:hypothetical protein